MFDLTSAYGMYPGRPLRILLISIFLFALIDAVLLCLCDDAAILVVPSDDRLKRARLGNEPFEVATRRLLAWKMERGPVGWRCIPVLLRIGCRVAAMALYFSVLSAFAIGWRELNVGNWLTGIQRREYTLRGTGWVRTASGVQAVLSVYLIALWALTYFSRPFE